MVQSARTQPLSREKVEECIRKTGNTPFLFEELTVSMDADAFLPVQALNALRRDALQALADALAGAYRRDEKSAAGRADRERQVCAKTEEECLIASVEERCQLAEALEHASLTDIYLDSSLYARGELPGRLLEDVGDVRRRGKRAYYILPAVFRAHTADFYRGLAEELRGAKLDGMVAKSYDAAAFVRETFGAGMPLVLDHNLYIWNQEAKEKLWELAPIRDTAPLELNRRELAGRDNEGSEILIYGYLPLMTTAQCIHAQLSGHAQRGHKGCDGLQTALCLRDRYGKYFTVKNRCAECYNTLYNSAPLMLFGYREELLAMGIRAFRLSFTTEDRADVRRILSVCEELFDARTAGKQGAKPDGRLSGEYTNGHYKRGVE